MKPHERIVASVIYYYDTHADIRDPGLSFRYLRSLFADFPREDDHNGDVSPHIAFVHVHLNC